MRRILYALILAALFFAPLERVDVTKLLPVRGVAVYMEGEMVVLETDTENKGKGRSVTEALADLKKTTSAAVYLDTAEFLLVSEPAITKMNDLRSILKPSVKVCVCDAAGRVEDAVNYLDIHGNLPKLRDWK